MHAYYSWQQETEENMSENHNSTVYQDWPTFSHTLDVHAWVYQLWYLVKRNTNIKNDTITHKLNKNKATKKKKTPKLAATQQTVYLNYVSSRA